jgi:hypothetical protein
MKNSIEHHLSFINERASGRFFLATFRYKKIAEIIGYDFEKMDKTQKMIFKSLCLDESVFENMNLERYGIFKNK